MFDRIEVVYLDGDNHFRRMHGAATVALMTPGTFIVLRDTPFSDGEYTIDRRVIIMDKTAEKMDRVELYLEWRQR
jgi:hypothetical protein